MVSSLWIQNGVLRLGNLARRKAVVQPFGGRFGVLLTKLTTKTGSPGADPALTILGKYSSEGEKGQRMGVSGERPMAARASPAVQEYPGRLPIGGGVRCRAAGCRTETEPELLESLERLVDPVTRGDPDSPLRCTCKSTTRPSQELRRQGHLASPRTVGRLLNALGYSLQSNRKTHDGASHPDRNAQFELSTPRCEGFSSAVNR